MLIHSFTETPKIIMSSSKKNFLLEFTDITDAEVNGIIKIVRHPTLKDQANSNNNIHAAVLAFFYRKRKNERDSFSQNMRVSIFKMTIFFITSSELIFYTFFLFFKAYIQLNDKMTFQGIVAKFDFVSPRKISQILPMFKYLCTSTPLANNPAITALLEDSDED